MRIAQVEGGVGALRTDGTSGRILYSFTACSTNLSGMCTNGDGANPAGRLILSGTTLYGTAENGGSSGNGTVFALNSNGTGFRVLHSFTTLENHTNSDGALPHTGLLLLGTTLYGMAKYGGRSRRKYAFAVDW